LDLRLSTGLLALGAADGRHGAVLVTDARPGSGIQVLPVPGARVAATLVGLVGTLTAGRARPVNLPAEILDDARRATRDGSYWTLADRLVDRGVNRADANSFARMCTGITADGRLGALTRGHTADRGVVEHRGPWVVVFHR